MTDDDFRRIEQHLAEEIRRKNCQIGAQQYDNDYYQFSDIDNPAPGMNRWKIFLRKNLVLSLDPSESMFCSVKGMSQSIDLETSYTSSRPDSASISSRISSFLHL